MLRKTVVYATARRIQCTSKSLILVKSEGGEFYKCSAIHALSPNRATLNDLITAIRDLPEGGHVKLVTDIDMGIGRLENSINYDLKREMVEALKAKFCTFEFQHVECSNSLWSFIEVA